MMKEMESRSMRKESEKPAPRQQPRRQVQRYSQQTVAKHRTETESERRGPSPQLEHKEVKSDKDSFSAAMDALSKLQLESAGDSGDVSTKAPFGGGKPKPRRDLSTGNAGLPCSRKGLSPSVAAVFDAVASNETKPVAMSNRSPNQPGSTATLKSILRMEDHAKPIRKVDATPSSSHGRMPEPPQTWMTPPTSSPRGPLLPHPFNRPPVPMRGKNKTLFTYPV